MISAPPLSRGLKASFAVGSMAEAIVISTTTQFLLLFYNQVRGAPAELVGLALSAGLVLNAVCDPLVGSWSDRTHSRLGRRHPFMFASMLPIAICFFAVFNPPDSLTQTGELIWLCVFNILLQQALTIFHTPHLAFGGELSQNYIERTNVMSYNMFFMWAGDTLCWLLSFGWVFRSRPGYPNGALDLSRWPRFSFMVAASVLAILFISTWFTRARIPFLPQAPADAPSFSFREFLRDMRRALTNYSYLMLLIGYFFLSLMSGVRGGLWLYGATYFWRLTNDQIAFFVIGSLVSYVFGSAAVTRMHRRFDKRATVAVAAAVYCIGPALPLTLGYFGILTFSTPGLLIILIAFSTLQHAPYSIMTTTLYSALADIADENELKYGIRQEGILYSARTFFSRVDQAVGAAAAGWVLAIIAFPAKAVPGHVDSAVLMGLAGAYALSTIPGLVAVYFYARIRVTRDSYAATAAALQARRAALAP